MPDTARLTWSLGFEFVAIHNVDLFRRGHYRVHLTINAPENGGVELSVANDGAPRLEGHHAATVTEDGKSAISTSVLIQYRQQRKILADSFSGYLHFCLPCKKLLNVLSWPQIPCTLELHHAPNTDPKNIPPPPSAFTKVSRHRMCFHLCPKKHQLHTHRPFLFDFCHLAGVQLRMHASLSHIMLDVLENPPSEKPRSTFRSAVRSLLSNSESAASLPFKRSTRPISVRSTKVGESRSRNRHRSVHGDSFMVSPRLSRLYRLEVLPINEATALCRLLLESKAALAEVHQQLIGGAPPVQNDIDELLRKMFRKGKRDVIPWSDTYDYISAISAEIDTLWRVFESDISETSAASQRLLFQAQHQRILRWREGILTQSQPISQCLALDVDCLPSLDALELQNFADKLTTDLYGRLAFEPLPLACKGIDGTHRNMPLILEQIFSGPDPFPREEDDRSSGGTLGAELYVQDSVPRTSSQPLMTLAEFLGTVSSDLSRKTSKSSIGSVHSASDMISLKDFLASGLQKHRGSNSSNSSSASEAGEDLMTLDEFLSIVTSGLATPSSGLTTPPGDAEDVADPVLSLSEFLESASPACAKVLRHRPPSTSQARGSNGPDEKFTVDELLAIFAASRVAPRIEASAGAPNGLSLTDFLSGGECSGILPREEVPSSYGSMNDHPMPMALEREDSFGSRTSSSSTTPDLVGMNVPSCKPASTIHLQLINEAKDHVRPALPPSWTFLSDGPIISLPLPYFSSVEGIQVKSKPVHLVVCVHGLEGMHLDLRMFSVYLRLALPDASLVFLKSKSNEQNTNLDFEIMIQCLVDELLSFIDEKELLVSRLSFVGHSLGNIIIRGALAHPALSHLLASLHVYISFAGPHLGTVHANSVVSTGMWLMRKLKKSRSLCQLAMKDHANKRETFLYKLSMKPGLALFKSILLVASHQDQYVPFHSAHIAVHPRPDAEDLGRIHMEMVQNLLRPLQYSSTELSRYTVVYHFQSTVDVNVLVGRAGHVAVLDNDLFLEKFVSLFCAPKFDRESVVTEC